jgi:hypothetical protein
MPRLGSAWVSAEVAREKVISRSRALWHRERKGDSYRYNRNDGTCLLVRYILFSRCMPGVRIV